MYYTLFGIHSLNKLFLFKVYLLFEKKLNFRQSSLLRQILSKKVTWLLTTSQSVTDLSFHRNSFEKLGDTDSRDSRWWGSNWCATARISCNKLKVKFYCLIKKLTTVIFFVILAQNFCGKRSSKGGFIFIIKDRQFYWCLKIAQLKFSQN